MRDTSKVDVCRYDPVFCYWLSEVGPLNAICQINEAVATFIDTVLTLSHRSFVKDEAWTHTACQHILEEISLLAGKNNYLQSLAVGSLNGLLAGNLWEIIRNNLQVT